MGGSKFLQVIGVACVLGVAGCSTTPKEEVSDVVEVTETETAAPAETESSANTYGADAGTTASGDADQAYDPDAALLGEKVVFFDFDKSVIKPEAFEVLKAHARKLVSDGQLVIRLEGHADERGTREYNLALGERRGHAVAKFLRVNGVSSSQMDIVSYGEEKPLAFGQSEQAWSQNRRVEISYQ
jgi:peptidoglycan-associated lipoprotein